MSHLSRITLRLARNPEAGFPEGDDRHGYVLVAPLDANEQLDLELWRKRREDCTVRRFSPEQGQSADGWLTHNGSAWRFHYDEDDEGPDEGLFKLQTHRLETGAYVTVNDADDGPLVYKVSEAVALHR